MNIVNWQKNIKCWKLDIVMSIISIQKLQCARSNTWNFFSQAAQFLAQIPLSTGVVENSLPPEVLGWPQGQAVGGLGLSATVSAAGLAALCCFLAAQRTQEAHVKLRVAHFTHFLHLGKLCCQGVSATKNRGPGPCSFRPPGPPHPQRLHWGPGQSLLPGRKRKRRVQITASKCHPAPQFLSA